MNQLNQSIIDELREMARKGCTVTAMFQKLQAIFGDGSIYPILKHMQSAFFLNISEASPIATLSLTDTEKRRVDDEQMLDEMVMTKITQHRHEWDTMQ